MKTVCEVDKCTGCMSCIEICPRKAISIEDTLSAYNAIIDESKCVSCQICQRICQKNNPPKGTIPQKWYQGWASDTYIRMNSSSGGFATAISLAFIDAGGIVYGCTFEKGDFLFGRASRKQEVRRFIGSKYVKSNPKGVYNLVKRDLRAGLDVLFIGLPCQVAAMKNYIGVSLSEKLYTIDLICHGTPSPKLFNLFLMQYECALSSMKKVSFRVKAKMQVHCDGKGIVTKGVSDKYTIAFLNALIYTENCYECDYARTERVSDVTIGDSWGSELPIEEQKQGVSLALCQTPKGEKLIRIAKLQLFDVDLQAAISSNHQLKKPSVKPTTRAYFFRKLKENKKFNALILKIYPFQCIKQDVKKVLLDFKILK